MNCLFCKAELRNISENQIIKCDHCEMSFRDLKQETKQSELTDYKSKSDCQFDFYYFYPNFPALPNLKNVFNN